MAELVGLPHHSRRRIGSRSGLLEAIGATWRRLLRKRDGSRIRAEDWSAYMLRDIGISTAPGLRDDPRSLPIDWPLR